MWREKHLRNLYSKIPPFKGCSQECDSSCCVVPFAVSEFEKERLPGHNFDGEGRCVFIKDGRCSVYEDRPFICRLYGTCNLYCGKTDGPVPLLDTATVEELLWDYTVLFWDVKSLKQNNLVRQS